MAISAKDKGWLLRRSRVTGVPAEVYRPVVQLFIRWADDSGPEWAVSRFKEVKVDYLRKKAGLSRTSVWFKKGSRGNWFSGPLGSLERWASVNERKFAQALALISMYTNFFARTVTKSQRKKFLSGVRKPVVKVSPIPVVTALVGLEMSGLKRAKRLPPAPSLKSYNPSPDKRAPTPFGSRPEPEGVFDSLGYLITLAGRQHLGRFSRLYEPVIDDLYAITDVSLWRENHPFLRKHMSPPGLVVGRIGFIQEAGFKLRYVANPGRVFQAVLEPMGTYLFQSLRKLPWDCTHDQRRHDSLIQSALSRGQMVHSIDLSSATDHFPLALQLAVLRELLPQEHVDLFEELSRSYWSVDMNDPLIVQGRDGANYLNWSVGQPLGLYPSFASFALTHGLLLLGLLGRRWNGEFALLGDDVVVLDDRLYERYLETLEILSCPVSLSKTLDSNSVAEFHSSVITRDSVLPQFKWRSISDDSFFDLSKNLGPRILPLLSPRQKRVVKAFSVLPEQLGGLGWNPDGLSMAARVEKFISLILRDKPEQERLTSYRADVIKMLWTSNLVASTDVGDISLTTALDQRAYSLTTEMFGGHVEEWLRDVLGKNLDRVFLTDLPIRGVRRTRRLSNLEVLERAICTLV